MKEVHKMYIEVLEEEIQNSHRDLENAERVGNQVWQDSVNSYIEGLQFALDKAKGILPL